MAVVHHGRFMVQNTAANDLDTHERGIEASKFNRSGWRLNPACAFWPHPGCASCGQIPMLPVWKTSKKFGDTFPSPRLRGRSPLPRAKARPSLGGRGSA